VKKKKFLVIEEGNLSFGEMGKIVGGEYPGCSDTAHSVVACWAYHTCTDYDCPGGFFVDGSCDKYS